METIAYRIPPRSLSPQIEHTVSELTRLVKAYRHDDYLLLSGVSTDNIARQKTAVQSSYDHGAQASRAVDGNSDGAFSHNTCTHTKEQSDPWWRVDLGTREPVSEVFLVNRAGCCRYRLTDVEVRVGELTE